MLQGLSGLRVVDFSSTIAGSYATKLLADAGAEVIKVEPCGGDPLRRWSEASLAPGADGPLFRFLNTGKQSVTGSPGQPHVEDLVASADIVVNTLPAERPEPEQWARREPAAVILSITPWGRSGPCAGRPATEFILQAESGSLSGRGLPEREPFMAGGRITEWVGGTYAAVAALAAWHGQRRSGVGDHLDFSLLEVMTIAGTSYADLMASLAGRPPARGPERSVELPSIEPTRDGWVGFTTNSNQQFTDFLLLIGRPDLREDRELASIYTRCARMQEWNEIVHAYTRRHTTAEIVEAAALLRIPVAPVNDGRSVLEHEHFRQRGVFVENPGGGFLQPRPPYLVNGQSPGPLRPAPAAGEHNATIAERRRRAQPPSPPPPGELPLAGVRVLDATAWWAGPSATQMLAHLGAEVIHLEAVQRLDGIRMLGGRFIDRPRWWEYSGMFLGANTNKLGLTLDLDQPAGLAAARDLIARCDVFVENYSPRVMEKFGLDWDAVRVLNPRTVMVRMPAFGLSGPWRDHVGFAQTMEQITGLAWLTGFADDQPRIQRGPCDPLAGMNAAFATLAALAEREVTGAGSLVECPMVEGALNAAAEAIVTYSATGHLMTRDGNRCTSAAPQGLYPCRAHRPEAEQWLALSVASDEQWRALQAVLGEPAELAEERYSSLGARRQHHDALDELLQGLLRARALDELLPQLLARGVPAGRVWPAGSASTHPQHCYRQFFEELAHPVVGSHPCVTTPFTSRYVRRWLRRPAPVLGEHNDVILRDILGYDEAQIAALAAAGVIGGVPTGLG